MNLLSILVRDLKTWPAQWGRFCVWAMAEGAPAAWFHTRRPEKIDGSWSDIGTVEHWLGERPSDDCVVTMEDWVEAIREAKALNAATAWTDEGTPPVGTVCELLMDKTWKVVEIRYLSKHTILAALVKDEGDDPEFALDPYGQEFRPIRTAEQIEATGREKAIQQMLEDAGMSFGTFDIATYGWASGLYDAGYRKHAAPVIEEDTSDIDYSIKAGDTVKTDHWAHSSLEVIDVNWALRAVAVRLGPTGGIVVWPARGMKKVAP